MMRLAYATVIAGLLTAACAGGSSDTSAPATTVTTVATTAIVTTTQPDQVTATVGSEPTSTVARTTSTVLLDQPTVTSTIEYADSALLDVYAPLAPGPWPVVLVVHGISQSRSEFKPLAEAIASQGAAVFNVGVPTSPPFFETIGHLACAVRFARATAADHGGDPAWVTVVGNSLGAATGAVVALAGDEFEGDCVVNDLSGVPDALVGYEGPYDYATHDYQAVNLVPLREDDPELWQAVNPYSHIGGNTDLVVRLIHGEDVDDIWYEVPPDASREFHQALADAGYDVELTLLKGASHVDLHPGTDAFEVTVQQVLETVHDLTAANNDSEPSSAMILTFGYAECVYEGPSVVSAGPANLTFVNNSGATGAVNVIELLDGKTWEDIVEYAGEQPSSKHAPSWTRDVRPWRPIPSGDTLLWEEELTPGTYAMVCANISPLAVWLGSSLEVDV